LTSADDLSGIGAEADGERNGARGRGKRSQISEGARQALETRIGEAQVPTGAAGHVWRGARRVWSDRILVKSDELIGVGKGERLEHHRVEQREDGAVCSDAKRQGDNRCEGETWSPAQ
jgi:hypothetical protein